MKTLFAILVTPFLFSYREETKVPLETGQLPGLILETPTKLLL